MAMSRTEAALFEATGPKARRRIMCGTIISIVALIALGVWIVYRFYTKGQLEPQYWYFFFAAQCLGVHWRWLGRHYSCGNRIWHHFADHGSGTHVRPDIEDRPGSLARHYDY